MSRTHSAIVHSFKCTNMNLLRNESSDIVYTPMTFFMSHCQKFIARNLLLIYSLSVKRNRVDTAAVAWFNLYCTQGRRKVRTAQYHWESANCTADHLVGLFSYVPSSIVNGHNSTPIVFNFAMNVKRAQIVVIELSLGGNAEVSNTPK